MKLSLFLFSLCLVLFSCQESQLKKISDDDLVDRILNEKMPPPEDIELRDWNGNEISLDSLKILEMDSQYFEDFYVNSENEIVKLVIREKTEADEQLLSKINLQLTEKMTPRKEVKNVDVDCDNLPTILNEVYRMDQGIRSGEVIPEPHIDVDHENLQIVVSILEQCGMPSREILNGKEMSAIWLVLQHSPPAYQSKYISLLETSAEKGDIPYGSIALMKDRALLHEGKPQIYGSQVLNDKLYKLIEPEYVNQRRAEVGLEPIEEYLKHFDIEFKVEQLTK